MWLCWTPARLGHSRLGQRAVAFLAEYGSGRSRMLAGGVQGGPRPPVAGIGDATWACGTLAGVFREAEHMICHFTKTWSKQPICAKVALVRRLSHKWLLKARQFECIGLPLFCFPAHRSCSDPVAGYLGPGCKHPSARELRDGRMHGKVRGSFFRICGRDFPANAGGIHGI